MTKNFALIGTAGYVAPRHLKAIKDNGGHLLASIDPSDSVGVIDSYFPNSKFFTSFERFDRHLSKLALNDETIDYLAVCSPNHLHDAHIRYGLRMNAKVICEKPLVLNPKNLDALEQLESESEGSVYTILQLRLIAELQELKNQITNSPSNDKHEVELSYITPRGNWYYTSWKGDKSRSGGIVCNIGIHLFDLLIWLFGPVEDSELHIMAHDRASGYLSLKNATVKWFLSINGVHLPKEAKTKGMPSYRNLSIDGREIEFSKGFTELHTRSYEAIMNGEGFGIAEARSSIELVHKINMQEVAEIPTHKHPLYHLAPSKHPFLK